MPFLLSTSLLGSAPPCLSTFSFSLLVYFFFSLFIFLFCFLSTPPSIGNIFRSVSISFSHFTNHFSALSCCFCVLFLQFFSHSSSSHVFSPDHKFIHYRLKRLDYLWPGCIPLHYFLLLSSALFTQRFTLTTPSCIPVATPTHNLFFQLI